VVLRRILLDSLPEGCIQWGKRVKKVEVGTIIFEDSTESGFGLIVGADGAWSKVRPLLTHIPPFYSGVSGFDIRLADAKKHPEIDAMVGNGSLFAFGESDRKVLLTQRNGDGSLRTYAMGPQPESWIKDMEVNSRETEEARAALAKEFADWSPELTRIIQDFDVKKGDSITPRSLYMLPVSLSWPSQPGVTVVGDAAHLMTPFAGEGVNMALADGLSLAQEIIKSPNDLVRAIQQYEKEMFPRSTRMTQKTWESLMSRFAPGAIQQFKDKVRRQLKELPEDHDMRQKVMVSEDETLGAEISGLQIEAIERPAE
jgi:2-polyprenyl-6-methoxyphenol hydroxylase-like FAD-dependent oxidoreductase